jgi:hypothetical protein
MAALAADAHHPHKGNLEDFKLAVKAVGADTFYAGALVFGDASNGKAQVTCASGDTFLGICARQVVATAADDLVEIYTAGLWLLPVTGAAEGDVGELVCVDISANSDNPADLLVFADLTPATNDLAIGEVKAIDIAETTKAWVQLLNRAWKYRADTGTGDVAWI